MRIRGYKERFVTVRLENEEKKKDIEKLQNALQQCKAELAENTQRLQRFSQTDERLRTTEISLQNFQKEVKELQERYSRTKAKLEKSEANNALLLQEYASMKERLKSLHEENGKLRLNNARLVMKLETKRTIQGVEKTGGEKQ